MFSYFTCEDPWRADTAFDVQVHAADDQQTLVMSGELDLPSVGWFETSVRCACTTTASSLVLDLREVTFMDSSGLRAIIAAGRACAQHGLEFLLIPGPPEIQRVFELTGVAESLPFEATE
jgi:anti-anti-sigma factor